MIHLKSSLTETALSECLFERLYKRDATAPKTPENKDYIRLVKYRGRKRLQSRKINIFR